MSYLVDTDRVASYLNGRPDAIDLLASLLHEGLAISLITYGEIYDGI
jgi:predicted nucleic acid-binding protein